MNGTDFWMQRALMCTQEAKIEAAIDYYKQGLRIQPTCESLLYNLACAFEKLGKRQNTLLWFKYALQLKPRWTDALYGVAVTQFKSGDFNSALEFIERAVETYRQGLVSLNCMIYLRSMCYKCLE